MYCKNCGNHNSDENNFCIKCGNRLEKTLNKQSNYPYAKTNKNQQSINFFRKKKSLALVALTIILLVVFIAIKPPSVNKVYKNIRYLTLTETTDYLDQVYPKDGGFLGIFKKTNAKRRTKVSDLLLKDSMDKLEELKEMVDNKSGNIKDVKIEKLELDKRNDKSKYVDLVIKVKNNGDKPVDYIKINLFFKDSADKIIKSDWTNDSSTILPGASQTIKTMVEKGDWKKVTAQIDKVVWGY